LAASKRPTRLWVRYSVLAVVFTVAFQIAYNYIQFLAPISQEARDGFFLQFFILLASTNLFALVVAIDYSRQAEPSIVIFDRAAFVIERIFHHNLLRGLTEREAADKMIRILDHIENARPLMEKLGRIQPRHLERGTKLLGLLLDASDRVSDEKLGEALGHRLEQAVADMERGRLVP